MKNYPISTFIIILCLTISTLTCSSGQLTDTPPPKQSANEYEEILSQFGLASKMEDYGIPGISFGVIKNGQLEWAKAYGVLQEGKEEMVNAETLFSVGSVSKVGTAVMILKLQEAGLLDIDEDVNKHLSSWKIPNNRYTQAQKVKLRQILSHTAGLTVHGFADFSPNEKLPTTLQILKGEGPAKNAPVQVDIPVGSQYRYSGGGTTVSQMVIEDLVGSIFHEAADSLLFEALGMRRSSYENPLPMRTGNIAKAHNRNGKPVALPRGYQSMPEAAASGLWTNPTDFSKLMIMLMEAYQGKSTYLSEATLKDMMQTVAPSEYGLGPRIEKIPTDVLFQHSGANDSYRAHFVGSLQRQNGVIIFTNGARGTDLIRELLPVFEEVLFKN